MVNPTDIKNYQHSIINQAKLWNYDTSNNVLDFKGNPIKYNPLTSMTFNWQMAKFNKQVIQWITLPLVVQEEFWNSWIKVYAPEGNKDAD